MPVHRRYRSSRKPRRRFTRLDHRTIVRHRFALLAAGILALFAFGLVLGRLERDADDRSPITGRREASPLDPINPFLRPPEAASANRNAAKSESPDEPVPSK